MKPTSIHTARKISDTGFTLVEVIGVITILGIVAMIAVPSVLGMIEDAKRDVCKVNRIELERVFEAEMDLKSLTYSEVLFIQFLSQYGDELCPLAGVITYADGEVRCSLHGEHDNEEETEDEGGVPYL